MNKAGEAGDGGPMMIQYAHPTEDDDYDFIPRNTPPPNTTHSSETPRIADTRVYRAGQYRPETHRYRRKW